MTQGDFDRLPLLLRWSQVEGVLEGMNRRAFLEAIADGTLRQWPPAPEPRHRRYYLKVDVARIAGLEMRTPQLPRLNMWMARDELLQVLGLGRHLFNEVCNNGRLKCEYEERAPWRLRLLAPRAFAALRGRNE